ncbi:MAG: NERD domain-containing protein [Hallerella sp.]|nr:NERD domain-containing protein [Hallerella sp.]
MGILDSIFNKYFGPVFVKEESDAEEFIEKMKSLSSKAEGKLKEKIDKQIAAAEAGLYGEKQIAYELKNSGMDMLIAHDLYLEKNDLSAQIDYLVVTHKHVFVIECKNLYGNIEIDDKGNFIRHKGQGKFYRKEGFTSPVSQNERHLNVLKEIRKEYKTNVLTQAIFVNKVFPQAFRSVVVLANPKTILNDKNAPKEVRDIVIRLDQLVAFIKRVEDSDDMYKSSEAEMRELMESFTKCSAPNKSDYAKKYEELLAEQKKDEPQGDEKYMPPEMRKALKAKVETEPLEHICPRCGAPLVLRTTKKGENAGKQFWGCSTFPKCRYILPLPPQQPNAS